MPGLDLGICGNRPRPVTWARGCPRIRSVGWRPTGRVRPWRGGSGHIWPFWLLRLEVDAPPIPVKHTRPAVASRTSVRL